jgi:glycosyltransferase involved in cell wall biosynthesis
MPRSVLEAMAFGSPVVATDVFGMNELIEDGETGLLVQPRDLASLERGLRRFLQAGRDERARLAATGEAFVRRHHDSRGYATAYRALLDGFAADPSAFPADLLG